MRRLFVGQSVVISHLETSPLEHHHLGGALVALGRDEVPADLPVQFLNVFIHPAWDAFILEAHHALQYQFHLTLLFEKQPVVRNRLVALSIELVPQIAVDALRGNHQLIHQLGFLPLRFSFRKHQDITPVGHGHG